MNRQTKYAIRFNLLTWRVIAFNFLLCQPAVAQIGTVTPPSASVSSFSTYVNSPAVTCSGIPDISYPILSLPTKSKEVTFDINMKYHPYNIANYQKASNVGLGWSLFGGGVISRYVNNSPDELYTGQYGVHPQLDDDYFYDFLGNSGRFRFVGGGAGGNYAIQNQELNGLKFEFVNVSTPAGLKVSSFKVRDTKGISYIFDKLDYISFNTYGSYGAFHLTKIEDQQGNLLATLEYEKTVPTFNTYVASHTLKKIISVGVGTIDFSMSTNQNLQFTRNDLVQINSIQLKNFRGELVKSCSLQYEFRAHQPVDRRASVTQTARFLKKLEFSGSDLLPVEKYSFQYIHRTHEPGPQNFDDYGYSKYGNGDTPENGRNGVLETITLPTGGKVVYDFMSNLIQSAYKPNNFDFFPRIEDYFEPEVFLDHDETNTTIAPGWFGYSGYVAGLRIDRIRYYDNINSTVPQKTVTYDYRDFNQPQYNSGQVIISKIMPGISDDLTYETKVYYKNIKVTEGTGNGYTKYCYYTPYDTFENIGPAFTEWRWFHMLKDGLLKYKETYDDDDIIKAMDKFYYYGGNIFTSSNYLINNHIDTYRAYLTNVVNFFTLSERYSQNPYSMTSQISGIVVNASNFKLNSESVFEPGASLRQAKYFYPNQSDTDPVVVALRSKNMVTVPLKTEIYGKNNQKLSTEKIVYDAWDGGYLAPKYLESSSGLNPLETKVKINKLDTSTGNPLEVENELGIKTSYIWGYNGILLLAKIENMAYAALPADKVSLLLQLSNHTSGNTSENGIVTQLKSLRADAALSSSMMTGYTYIPLVGVTNIIDSRGNIISYKYDAYGRLLSARDNKGNLISENKYNYKPQN